MNEPSLTTQPTLTTQPSLSNNPLGPRKSVNEARSPLWDAAAITHMQRTRASFVGNSNHL